MEGAEKGEKSGKESLSLRVDPKCHQEALGAFFPPVKTGDPRADFYTIYERKADEHDADYVKKCNEDLNTTLIFAGLFSVVSAAFVANVHPNLQNDKYMTLLHDILLTLNQSAIPGKTENIPSEILTVTGFMYASLLISLLAVFTVMLGKQRLNRYLRNSGGSMIERCEERRRKRDELEKWPLHSFVESLPVMLQAALLLLVCGLCQHMWSMNTLVPYTLVHLTGPGAAFYLAIVVVGTSVYTSSFQTSASIAFRSGIASFYAPSKRVLSWPHQMGNQGVQSIRRQLLSMTPDIKPWLKPERLAALRRTNANDAWCVSWVLRNITDPEALDAAIRLAGEIRWFDDGVNGNPPYDLIVSIHEACFDSTGSLNPGARDRAYYSGRAMIWIRTLAMCKSEEFASTFPLQDTDDTYTAPGPDSDLAQLLVANYTAPSPSWLVRSFGTNRGHTPSHSQWISNVLLHLCWANRTASNPDNILNWTHENILAWNQENVMSRSHGTCKTEITVPLNTTLNRLLMWTIFLGSPVEEDALKVQDKTDHMMEILNRLSKAILSAISGTHTQRESILHVLCDLIKLDTYPKYLTMMAYDWCSAICENRQNLRNWETLLLISLEIGFRRLDIQDLFARLTHTEHHLEMVNVVFKSRESETIADLLHAWTAEGSENARAGTLVGVYAGSLVGLHDLVPFSSRLRRFVIRSVGLFGYKGFEGVGVGVGGFIELLDHLHVTIEDMDGKSLWVRLLLDTLQSSEGAQRLSHWYWELLAELAVSESQWPRSVIAYSPQITTFLTKAQEWSKLECWMGTVWMLWAPETAGTLMVWPPRPTAIGIAEKDLENSTLLLFRQRPDAVQKLERWLKQWSQKRGEGIPGWAEQNRGEDIPELFQRICKKAREAARQDVPPISTTKGTVEPTHYPSSASSLPSGGKNLWESLPF